MKKLNAPYYFMICLFVFFSLSLSYLVYCIVASYFGLGGADMGLAVLAYPFVAVMMFFSRLLEVLLISIYLSYLLFLVFNKSKNVRLYIFSTAVFVVVFLGLILMPTVQDIKRNIDFKNAINLKCTAVGDKVVANWCNDIKNKYDIDAREILNSCNQFAFRHNGHKYYSTPLIVKSGLFLEFLDHTGDLRYAQPVCAKNKLDGTDFNPLEPYQTTRFYLIYKNPVTS